MTYPLLPRTHRAQILSTSGAFLKFHFLMHGQHHKFPLDKGRLVFPLVPAFITGAVLCVMSLPRGCLLSIAPSLRFLFGNMRRDCRSHCSWPR